MTVIVTGRRARRVCSETFADLTDALLVDVAVESLSFDGDLSAEVQAAILERATTPETPSPTARAVLAAALEEHGSNCPLAAEVARYLLGDFGEAP